MPEGSATESAEGVAPSESVTYRILTAASQAFMEDGYAGASTLKIATRAKVSKRELYALFGSKQDLLTACVTARAERLGLQERMPTPRTAAELQATLVSLGTQLIEEICDPAVVAVRRLAVAEATRLPQIGKALEDVREQTTVNISEFIGRAQDAGLVQSGDPTAMAHELLTLLVGSLLLRLMQHAVPTPTSVQAQDRARHVAGLFMTLYAARD